MKNKTKQKNKIVIIGAGIWGTTLAEVIASTGIEVCLWEYFKDVSHQINATRIHPNLPGLKINPDIIVTPHLKESLDGSQMCIFAIPSKFARKIATGMRNLVPQDGAHLFLSVSKGIEKDSIKTVSEIIEEEIPHLKGKVMAMSGPSFATEVLNNVPTKLMLAGYDKKELLKAKKLLEIHPLKVEISLDRKGLELGGALKNAYAIGSGIIAGLKDTGSNTQAAFLTHSLAELNKIILAMGGNSETVYSLATIGDLILTGTSTKSRNYAFGEKIGKGMSVESALKQISSAVEGLETVTSAKKLCTKLKIKAPIISAIWKILYKKARPSIILESIGFSNPSIKIIAKDRI